MKDNPVHPSPAASPRFTFSLNNAEVGAVPLILFVGIASIVAISAWAGLLPKNMIGGLAVIMTLGFAFAKIGRQIPVLKDIGGPAILCLMVPSILVYFGVFQKHTLDTVHLLMKEANLLYFVIACLVVGSILGMNRILLIQGMIRMFVPLVVGTLMAVLSGLIVGSLFGFTPYHTFFFIIVPIIGGGIGGDFAAVTGVFGNTGANTGRLRCPTGTGRGGGEYLCDYLRRRLCASGGETALAFREWHVNPWQKRG